MSSCIDKTIPVREVWSRNLDHDFKLIRSLIDEYSYISMDTEFPGVVFKTKHEKHHGKSQPLEHYKLLKSNITLLNLIQLGLTLTDKNGNLPCIDVNNGQRVIWEFNFKEFDVARDAHAPESIKLLRKQRIDFEKNKVDEVDCVKFAELMMSSGLVCNEDVSWVTFHSAYDFGYLLKILTSQALPREMSGFLESSKVFFDQAYLRVNDLLI